MALIDRYEKVKKQNPS